MERRITHALLLLACRNISGCLFMHTIGSRKPGIKPANRWRVSGSPTSFQPKAPVKCHLPFDDRAAAPFLVSRLPYSLQRIGSLETRFISNSGIRIGFFFGSRSSSPCARNPPTSHNIIRIAGQASDTVHDTAQLRSRMAAIADIA